MLVILVSLDPVYHLPSRPFILRCTMMPLACFFSPVSRGPVVSIRPFRGESVPEVEPERLCWLPGSLFASCPLTRSSCGWWMSFFKVDVRFHCWSHWPSSCAPIIVFIACIRGCQAPSRQSGGWRSPIQIRSCPR